MSVAVGQSPTKEQFASQLNRSFAAAGPDGREFELTLTECEVDLDSDTQETFSLIFAAPRDTPTEQAIYRLTNQAVGEQEVFLVPIRQDEHCLYLQAVYNRFKR